MRRVRRPSHATVVAYIALFLVLTGGTAVALNGQNTVFTDDIANDTQPASGGNPAGGLQAADLRPGSVGSSEAANNSLTGDDVNENTLDRVRYSVNSILGGKGRSSPGGDFCDPEEGTDPDGSAYVNCALVSINLPGPSNVLLSGHATAFTDTRTSTSEGHGACRIGAVGHGAEDGSTIQVDHRGADGSQYTSTTVWGPFPAGSYSFGLDCKEGAPTYVGNLQFYNARITAVGLSGD
jgi:hypothetical protein